MIACLKDNEFMFVLLEVIKPIIYNDVIMLFKDSELIEQFKKISGSFLKSKFNDIKNDINASLKLCSINIKSLFHAVMKAYILILFSNIHIDQDQINEFIDMTDIEIFIYNIYVYFYTKCYANIANIVENNNILYNFIEESVYVSVRKALPINEII